MPDAKKDIIKAAKQGHIGNLQALLAADADLVHARDADGSTPLHCATWKGQREAVVYFLLPAPM
jgi:ankyrin repeat protein